MLFLCLALVTHLNVSNIHSQFHHMSVYTKCCKVNILTNLWRTMHAWIAMQIHTSNIITREKSFLQKLIGCRDEPVKSTETRQG